jgi:hypothetical protein
LDVIESKNGFQRDSNSWRKPFNVQEVRRRIRRMIEEMQPLLDRL